MGGTREAGLEVGTSPLVAGRAGVSTGLWAALRRTGIRPRLRRRHLCWLGGCLAILLALSAVLPEPAHAGLVDGAVKKIFGVKGDWISGTFVQWLIAIKGPGLTSDGAGAALYVATRDFAFAALTAVLTLSVIHYWAAGIFSQGGGAGVAIEGLVRTLGAALFILAWPFLIDTGVALSALIRDELVPGAKLDLINASLAASSAGSAPASLTREAAMWQAGLVVGIIIAATYALVALALYVTKVMLTVALLTIAGLMPLGMVLWAIPALSWFANAMLKACAAIVAVQVAWAGEVFLFAGIPSDWLSFSGEGHVLSKIAGPITMIALLILMVLTAPWVMRLAGMGGGQFLSFMASQWAAGKVGNLESAGRQRFAAASAPLREAKEQIAENRAAIKEGKEVAGQTDALARRMEHSRTTAESAADAGDKTVEGAQRQGQRMQRVVDEHQAWGEREAQQSAQAHSAGRAEYAASAGSKVARAFGALSPSLQGDVARTVWSHHSPQQALRVMAQRPGLESGHRQAILGLSQLDDDQLSGGAIPRPEIHAQAPPTDPAG
jgi:hypothetical protein